MNKRHYEHTLPNIRGSLSNTYVEAARTIYRLYNHVRCIVERGPKRRADKRCMQRIDVAVSIRQEK